MVKKEHRATSSLIFLTILPEKKLAKRLEKGAINSYIITDADFTVPYDIFLDSGKKNSGWEKKIFYWSSIYKGGHYAGISSPKLIFLCFQFQMPRRQYHCTAKTLYRKCETNIPGNEIARPRSQILHSRFCERFIYSHDRSAIFCCWKIGEPTVRIYKSLINT